MTADPAPPAVQARLKHLSLALHGPQYRAIWVALGVAVAGALTTAAVIIGTRDLAVALAVALAFLGLQSAAMAWLFRSKTRRQAAELNQDHDCRESREWAAAAGGRLPRTRKGWERWLVEQPNAPGRFTILLGFGRLAEAEAEIDRVIPRTPDDRFGVALMQAQLATIRGAAPDLEPLKDVLRTIPDKRRQNARKQCITHLAAWQAVDRGEDPLEVLARGRRNSGLLDGRSSIGRIWFGLTVWPLLAMEIVWVAGLLWVGF